MRVVWVAGGFGDGLSHVAHRRSGPGLLAASPTMPRAEGRYNFKRKPPIPKTPDSPLKPLAPPLVTTPRGVLSALAPPSGVLTTTFIVTTLNYKGC